jgi:hypothetical protein
MIFRMLGVLAEFERDLVSERRPRTRWHQAGKASGLARSLWYELAPDNDRLDENETQQERPSDGPVGNYADRSDVTGHSGIHMNARTKLPLRRWAVHPSASETSREGPMNVGTCQAPAEAPDPAADTAHVGDAWQAAIAT